MTEKEQEQRESIGPCALCGRPMFEGKSLNKHHLVPKTFGGKEATTIHAVCHSKIHTVFTDKELNRYYHTFERLLEKAEIQKFVKWIAKKDPEYYKRNRPTRAKRAGAR